MKKKNSWVTLFVGRGAVVEKRVALLRTRLEMMGYKVVTVPVSEEGELALSNGQYVYRGDEIDEIEKRIANACGSRRINGQAQTA